MHANRYIGLARNLHYNYHIVMVEGVWSGADEKPVFHYFAGPDDVDTALLAKSIADNLISLLRKDVCLTEEGDIVKRCDGMDPLF